MRQRAFYVSAMTALKNRVHAFLAQQQEEVRQEAARETNIFSVKGQKMLLGLDLSREEKSLLVVLLKTYRLEKFLNGSEQAALADRLRGRDLTLECVRTWPSGQGHG